MLICSISCQMRLYKTNHNSSKKEQNKYAFWILIFTIIIISYSCKKASTSPNIPKTPEVSEKDPDQYDTPFKKVPNTSDIIMYEINLRAFTSQGTLKAAISRLDAIKELGINVVWLMPIHPIGELKGIGSPYAVRDYNAVNSEFGTLENLREFVKEAHKRDMSVILDWVANHTSWDNLWIKNKSWYTQDATGNIVSPNGWNDVADLNFSNQAMRKEMIKAMKYWVLAANVDGYRCDYADGVPYDFWKQAIDTLKKIPNRDLIFFAEGTRTDHYSAGFSLNFGWNFFNTLKDVFNNNATSSKLNAANANDYANMPANCEILRFISNHDDNAVDNAPFATFKGKAGSMAAFVATLYMDGVPLIYNGQEVGNAVKLSFFTKTPIDWTTNPDVAIEYKKLISFRKSSNAIKTGSIINYSNNPDIVAFKKTSGIEEVLVLVNIRGNTINYTVDVSLRNKNWKNALDESDVTLSTTVDLAPFSYLVLKNK